MGDFLYQKLVEEIETTRQHMMTVGLKNGLTHSDTIKLSTKLDNLLNFLSLYKQSSK
ncbi:aspartyl-phosphate phosphatase Spo0E family protein [Anaerobacillus sp. MEB173]|uniref:aspartyl-phosphate phosphatase Spo0E family protein n=1 Tax=Anaerobacillus sp. MEB173 TaxID=3383345 RepID=UPI003F91766B